MGETKKYGFLLITLITVSCGGGGGGGSDSVPEINPSTANQAPNFDSRYLTLDEMSLTSGQIIISDPDNDDISLVIESDELNIDTSSEIKLGTQTSNFLYTLLQDTTILSGELAGCSGDGGGAGILQIPDGITLVIEPGGTIYNCQIQLFDGNFIAKGTPNSFVNIYDVDLYFESESGGDSIFYSSDCVVMTMGPVSAARPSFVTHGVEIDYANIENSNFKKPIVFSSGNLIIKNSIFDAKTPRSGDRSFSGNTSDTPLGDFILEKNTFYQVGPIVVEGFFCFSDEDYKVRIMDNVFLDSGTKEVDSWGETGFIKFNLSSAIDYTVGGLNYTVSDGLPPIVIKNNSFISGDEVISPNGHRLSFVCPGSNNLGINIPVESNYFGTSVLSVAKKFISTDCIYPDSEVSYQPYRKVDFIKPQLVASDTTRTGNCITCYYDFSIQQIIDYEILESDEFIYQATISDQKIDVAFEIVLNILDIDD